MLKSGPWTVNGLLPPNKNFKTHEVVLDICDGTVIVFIPSESRKVSWENCASKTKLSELEKDLKNSEEQCQSQLKECQPQLEKCQPQLEKCQPQLKECQPQLKECQEKLKNTWI